MKHLLLILVILAGTWVVWRAWPTAPVPDDELRATSEMASRPAPPAPEPTTSLPPPSNAEPGAVAADAEPVGDRDAEIARPEIPQTLEPGTPRPQASIRIEQADYLDPAIVPYRPGHADRRGCQVPMGLTVQARNGVRDDEWSSRMERELADLLGALQDGRFTEPISVRCSATLCSITSIVRYRDGATLLRPWHDLLRGVRASPTMEAFSSLRTWKGGVPGDRGVWACVLVRRDHEPFDEPPGCYPNAHGSDENGTRE